MSMKMARLMGATNLSTATQMVWRIRWMRAMVTMMQVDVDEDGIVDGCDDNVVMPQTPDYTIQGTPWLCGAVERHRAHQRNQRIDPFDD
jgi:hypothetical protein